MRPIFRAAIAAIATVWASGLAWAGPPQGAGLSAKSQLLALPNASSTTYLRGDGTWQTGGGSGCPLSGCTYSGTINTNGIVDSGGINTTAVSGYQVNGATGLAVTVGNAGQQAVFCGPGAGAYILTHNVATGYGGFACGVNAGSSLTGPANEFALAGAYTGQYATTSYGMTGFGEHNWGYANCNLCTASGNDAGRDIVGGADSSFFGAQSGDDGTGAFNTADGTLSQEGNAGSIIIGGTKTTGDVLKVTLTSTNPNVSTLPATVSYTVQAGDTLASIGTGLAAAISGVGAWTPGGGPIPGNGVQVGAIASNAGGSPSPIIHLHFPGGQTAGWAIIPTVSCTGTCTETMTVNAEYSGSHNLSRGVGSLYAAALTTGSYNDADGDYALSSLQGSASGFIAKGYNAGASLIGYTSGSTVPSIIIGQNQILNATTSAGDVIINPAALTNYATGKQNTLINGGNDITSGVGNIEFGYGSTVQTGSNNWQMSIGDAFYGYNNNKGGGGGYGTVGAYCTTSAADNATFTICDAAGANTTYGSHLGIQQTTLPTITNGTIDTHGSDTAGTVALTAANPVVTFKVAFATTPHCVVSSPSGAVTTYSASTTALTVTGGISTNTLSYVCLQ